MGWRTIRDEDLDRHWMAIERGDIGGIAALHGLLYECPQCGRRMWKKEGAKEYKVFSSEPSSSD
jgi:hypothetical protein